MTSPFDQAMMSATPCFLSTFGQEIVVLPDGGAERAITAIVDYGGIEQVPGLPQGKSQAITITVANDATSGLSTAEFDAGHARVRISERLGRDPVEKRIVKILSQNAGWVKYQVQ